MLAFGPFIPIIGPLAFSLGLILEVTTGLDVLYEIRRTRRREGDFSDPELL